MSQLGYNIICKVGGALLERKKDMRKRKKPKKTFKVKHRLTIKINLLFFTLEWEIEVGK